MLSNWRFFARPGPDSKVKKKSGILKLVTFIVNSCVNDKRDLITLLDWL